MKKLILTGLIMLVLVQAWSQVPKTISFQGYLTDKNTGDPLTASYDMKFSFYDALSGGTEVWFDDYAGVAVTKGVYNVVLGDKKPLAFNFDRPYFLQIKVGLEILTPRITLSASPYSLSVAEGANIQNDPSDDNKRAIASDHIKTSAVTSSKILSDALDDNKRAVTKNHIKNLAVSTEKMDDGAVTNDKLGAGAVTDAKIANIAASKILQGSASNGQILRFTTGPGWGPVDVATAIGTGVITSTHIANNSIVTTDVSSIDGSKIVPAFGSQPISTSGTLSAGDITGTSFTGNGFALSNLDAAKITGGVANRVAIWGASGISSNSGFIWDNTNNRMGIGTSPTVPLHVDALAGTETLRLEANATPTLSLYEGATYRAFIQALTGDLYIGATGTTNSMLFMTNGNVGITMNSARLVGIGRTPTTNRLEVNGEASKTTASGWAANSDRRIKKDITDINDGLSVIRSLHPVKFRYTDEWRRRNPGINDRFYYNYIAQEYREVFPDAVKGSGEFLDGDPQEILQIDTYDTQIVTVKAIQELLTKVEKLEEENKKLQAQLADVRNALHMQSSIQKH